jgi:hypothetical protein
VQRSEAGNGTPVLLVDRHGVAPAPIVLDSTAQTSDAVLSELRKDAG